MRKRGGFTLIELMFAVAILGVLVSVAVVAYTRNVRKARAGEVPQIFGELKMREETFRAERGFYVPVCPNPSGTEYQDCAEGDYWPEPLPGKGKAMDASTPPTRWNLIKATPPQAQLYCQYEVIAGKAGNDTNIGATGDLMFTAPPVRNWYYLMAQCDWDGDSAVKATYWQRDDWMEIGKLNEGR